MWNQMTAFRFQTERRHQTSPASIRGEGGGAGRTKTAISQYTLENSDVKLYQSQSHKLSQNTNTRWEISPQARKVTLPDSAIEKPTALGMNQPIYQPPFRDPWLRENRKMNSSTNRYVRKQTNKHTQQQQQQKHNWNNN